MSFVAVALWGAFVMGSIFYTQEARHPETKPLVAFLVFVGVFTIATFIIFAALSLLVQGFGVTEGLRNPGVAMGFLLAVFVPAFLLARWQIRKPPRDQEFPEGL